MSQKAEQQQRIQSPKVENAAGYCKQLNCSKRMLIKWCMSAHGDCEKKVINTITFFTQKVYTLNSIAKYTLFHSQSPNTFC